MDDEISYIVMTEQKKVAEDLYEQMRQVVWIEYANSSYVDINTDAYYVWRKYNWWMVPWYKVWEDAKEDPFGVANATSTDDATDDATDDGDDDGASVIVKAMRLEEEEEEEEDKEEGSWTSTIYSSVFKS